MKKIAFYVIVLIFVGSMKIVTFALPPQETDLCPKNGEAVSLNEDCQKITGNLGGVIWMCMGVPQDWQKYCYSWTHQ